MKMLYIKIYPCFTYLFQKCMPTYNFSAYNKSLIGFPQSSKAQQAYSVVLTTSFVDRQTAYVPLFFFARTPDLHLCTAFFLYTEK